MSTPVTPPSNPQFVRYTPTLEQIPDDEAETIQGLTEALRSISERVYEDSGHAVRSVHAKSHGLLSAVLDVPEGLPPHLAQGIFAKPGRYDVVMRFSTNPGDILDDSISTPRGLAVKIIGVEGERLPGSEGENVQDIVMQNAPAFTAATPKAFLKTLKLLAATTDKAPGLKKALSAVLRGTEKALEAVGGESGTLKSLGGHPETNLLGETYYSIAPVRYGDYVAKLSLAPVSASLTNLTDAPVEINGHPNGLRESVNSFFVQQSGEWEVRVQLCTNVETMPIEDASVRWPEDESPFVTVAKLTAGPQTAWSEARAAVVDERMAFGPWHGVVAHQPLGGVMRARKTTYQSSADYRSERNGCPIHQPREQTYLPE
ncbi:catalase family protein [Schauerella aestuarii]|uniref:catalase family protein n=1 Tax=Schauerella aestuarii TaxID=2511204 RepID=UPI001369E7E8|nr:catalase family protein [Achromobacter aestuarii]MYZ43539.1 catalase [Achromobacter aestuarii]